MPAAASFSFWKATLILFRVRRTLVLSLAAMVLSAVGFGAGVGLFLPVFQLLLGSSPADLARLYLQNPAIPGALRASTELLLSAFPSDRFWAFTLLMGLICLAGILSSGASFAQELLSARVIRSAVHGWRTRIFRHVLHLPLSDSLRFGSSDFLSRLVGDTEVLAQGYAALLGTTSCDLLRAVAALMVALALDWRLALLCLAGGVPTAFLMRKLGRSIRSSTARLLAHNADMIGTIQDLLRGLTVVKVHQAERAALQKFRRVSRRQLGSDLRSRRAKAVGSPAVEVVTICGVTLVACMAAWFVFRRNVEPASVLALLLALSGASQSLRTASKLAHKIQEADMAARRLFAVLDTPMERVVRDKLRSLPRHSRSIDFEGVSFSYPGRLVPALENIDLHIEHGQVVALVGENGAGKSTLVNLLPRLFEPDRGRVLIDGHDIANVTVSSLRRQIAMVPQQTVLFNWTILKNLTLGMRVSRKRLLAAARAACADEFIEPLERGYLTRLGESGAGLSEGQKQRLAIARALVRRPRILLLDEPTSQIDLDSEAKIHQVLRRLAGVVTLVVIAHRPGTIELADMVVRMDQGRIVQVSHRPQTIVKAYV